MKSLISILLFITLPFIIYGEKTSRKFPSEVALLNEMARRQLNIDGVLHLKADGFVADSSIGFVYQGNYMRRHKKGLVVTDQTLAIKFVSDASCSNPDREVEMYKYLKAYRAVEAKKYGIPTVYYHGKWGNFTLIALTKLDSDIAQIAEKLSEPLDILILMRNFIIQLKYIHSCGVRHDDVNPTNIMVHGHKSFLIDFDMSSKIMEDNIDGTTGFASRRMHQRQSRLPIDDLESFFYSICHVLGCQFEWCRVSGGIHQRFQTTGDLKLRSDDILNCIERCISDKVLKMVIHGFAKEIYADPPGAFPNYNHLYGLVNGKIEQILAETPSLRPIFSWLTDAQKAEAEREIHSQTPLNITDIVEPKSIDFTTFVYTAVENV